MGGWREGSVMEYLGEQLAEGQRKAMEFRRDASGKFQDFIGQNGKVFDDWSGKKAKWIDTGLSKNGTPGPRPRKQVYSGLRPSVGDPVLNGLF